MQAWARQFGFGQPPGSTSAGKRRASLPTPAWRKRDCRARGTSAWNPGDLIQMAIGQKDINVTPLQMARFYAAIANGGNLVTPYVVSSIEQPSNDGSPPVALDTFPAKPPQPIKVDPLGLSVVRDGLYQATHDADGTSSGVFGSFPVPVAGKTGTAEKVVPLPGLSVRSPGRPGVVVRLGPFDGTT